MYRNFFHPWLYNSTLNSRLHTSASLGNVQPNTRQLSVFRAVNTGSQPLSVSISRVQYPVEKTDLNNEYNPATSTFTPFSNGVYSLIASIYFSPNTPVAGQHYFLKLLIRINGTVVASDTEWIPGGDGVIAVSTIQRLQAGDTVEVLANSGRDGKINGTAPLSNIQGGGPDQTRFEGARVA